MKFRRTSYFVSAVLLSILSSSEAQSQNTAISAPVPAGFGVEFDIPSLADPDSLILSRINLDLYRSMILFDEHVLVTDSITGLTLRLFSQEEYRKKSFPNGLEMASPARYPDPSKQSED